MARVSLRSVVMNRLLPLIVLSFACSGPDAVKDSGGDSAVSGLAPADQRGPHAVGTWTGTVPGTIADEFDVVVWFPAEADGENVAEYGDFLGDVSYGGYDDVTPDCSEARQTVVLSHGGGSEMWMHAYLGEYLASHGYVVVAPAHPNGTILTYSQSDVPERFYRRAWELGQAFDWAAAGSEALPAGCVDEDAGYAVVGHSVGGLTALLLAGGTVDLDALDTRCEDGPIECWVGTCGMPAKWREEHPGASSMNLRDDRVWAVVALTPAVVEVFPGGWDTIDVPIMVLAAEIDTTTPTESHAWATYQGVSTPKYYGVVQGGGHKGFSIACELMGDALSGCGSEYALPEDIYRVTNGSITAFLGRTLGEEGYDQWLPLDDEMLGGWESE
jgi:pimeloyl-ACP methyl ester carboxylesterase